MRTSRHPLRYCPYAYPFTSDIAHMRIPLLPILPICVHHATFTICVRHATLYNIAHVHIPLLPIVPICALIILHIFELVYSYYEPHGKDDQSIISWSVP